MTVRIVFVDLEMTPIARQLLTANAVCRRETIQFGAVKLGDDGLECDSLSLLVKPDLATMTPHVTELTGITDEMLLSGIPFAEALSRFAGFSADAEIIYAWSESDLRQIQTEYRAKKIPFSIDTLVNKWRDFQREFTDRLGLMREVSLENAFNMVDITLGGRMHDALYDARNTALLYQKIDDPAVRENIGRINAAVNRKEDRSERTTFTLADKLKGLL